MAASIEKPSEASAPSPVAAGALGLRPLRSRYVIAALLPLVALSAAIGWYGSAWSAGENQYLRMEQRTLPSVVTLPGPNEPFGGPKYWVYAEGLTTVTGVRVTNTAGQVFPVTMVTKPVTVENYGGLSPKEVAWFDVSNGPRPPLPLRIEITGNGNARVGGYHATEFPNAWVRWGIAALLVVNIGAAVTIIVVPIVRRRRHSALGDADTHRVREPTSTNDGSLISSQPTPPNPRHPNRAHT
jgi:hypothetical protein